MERGPREDEPHMKVVRHPFLSWAMRDDLSGEVVWMPLLSVRDMARRAGMVARYYHPVKAKGREMTIPRPASLYQSPTSAQK